jgi:arylsulfatase A-like enzyme
LTEANADMIFPVPLFIKLPNQPKGQISGQDVQSIDLVPTIAAITGIHLTWSPDGRDIYAPSATSREKIMYAAGGRKFAYPANFAETVPDSPAR